MSAEGLNSTRPPSPRNTMRPHLRVARIAVARAARTHGVLPGPPHRDQLRLRPPPPLFTMWMAGGGVKRGFSFGETDDYWYNVVANPVHVHDLQATILRCLGIDHLKLSTDAHAE